MIETERIVQAIQAAPLNPRPFNYVVLKRLFAEESYRQLIGLLPRATHYAELRHKDAILADGSCARLEFPLTEESLRTLEGTRRRFWKAVADALRHPLVKHAFAKKLAASIASRSIPADARTNLRISLLRDLPGYRIRPHQDIPQKLITVQFYLPADLSQIHLGTSLYRRNGVGELERLVRLPFLPNTGYAFGVTPRSWHGVDRIPGGGESPRNSLMLTWYLDGGWQKLRASAAQAARSLRSRYRTQFGENPRGEDCNP